MTGFAPTDKPLTLAMVRDVADRLKAADDAQRTGSGVLIATAEGFKWVPIENVALWLWHG